MSTMSALDHDYSNGGGDDVYVCECGAGEPWMNWMRMKKERQHGHTYDWHQLGQASYLLVFVFVR